MSAATIESFFVVEKRSLKLVFEYPLSSSPPSYRDLLNLLVSDKSHDDEHILAMTKSLVVYTRCLGPSLLVACICSSTMPPMVAQEFLGQLGTIFYDYFAKGGGGSDSNGRGGGGILTGSKIEAHSDTVSLIVNDAIDAGFPTITEPDTMRQFVPFQEGLLHKLLLSSNNKRPFPPQLDPPWRRAGVKHTTNELYVDVIESLQIVLTPTSHKSAAQQAKMKRNTRTSSAFYSNPPAAPMVNSYKTLISRAYGSIICQCNISGVPEIQMTLSNKTNQLKMPYLHPCIQTQKNDDDNNNNNWGNKSSSSSSSSRIDLNFIPPDGEFKLFSYTIEDIGRGLVNAEMTTGLGIDGDEFEVRIFTPIILKSNRGIENLIVDIVCDSKRVNNIRNLRVSSGEFGFDAPGLGRWRFPTTSNQSQQSQGWNATLRGSLVVSSSDDEEEEEEDDDDDDLDKVQQQIKQINIRDGSDSTANTSMRQQQQRQPPQQDKKKKKKKKDSSRQLQQFPKYLELNYLCKGTLASGTKIDGVNIVSVRGLSESVKPYKGVKYTTKSGGIIIRR